jgi:hypothetical protein
MADPAFDPQLVHQVQKPMLRSGGFDANEHGARKLGIKLSHIVALARFTISPVVVSLTFGGERANHIL